METEHPEHHQNQKKENIIAASVIVGAILISASIFYNTKLILQEFGWDAVNNRLAAVGQSGSPEAPAVPSGVAPSVPAAPVNVAERADAPAVGKSNAKVTFIEFVDFQCPFCQRFFNDAYKQIKSKYVDAGKVRVVFMHYPLSFHQNAQKASEAAECANRQRKFVEYHDVLFQKGQVDGTGLDQTSLKQYATDLSLNNSKFNQCLDGGETAQVVKDDLAAGTAAGVTGTPTMFINGKMIVGAQPFASFEQAIEAALKN